MLHKEDKTEMKKKRALRILSLILLCALTFTACKKNVGTPEDNAASKDENTEEKDKDEQESWKIGFSGIDMENPYFLTLESAIKEEVDGKNCELIVKDPKTDPDMQASQIQEMIDEGINAIILSPVDWEKITPSLEALKEATNHFSASREKEGENLKTDILAKLEGMKENVAFIEERYPSIVSEYRKKLEDKVAELLGDTNVDENRIAAEVVIYSDKICVDEETVRLKSHIDGMRDELLKGGNVGRKLDFIAQEMNREANTILSKANDIEVSDHAIDLKTEIEKIREQVQNIE